jgi:hypothetical protein
MLILLTRPPIVSGSSSSRAESLPAWWKNAVVVGDAYHPEFDFMSSAVPSLIQQFGLEGFHNSIQAWIDYRDWAQFPAQWSSIQAQVQTIHGDGVPIGSEFQYGFSECGTTPISTPCGLSYLYETMDQQQLSYDQKWRFPNGTVASNPIVIVASHSFAGPYLVGGNSPGGGSGTVQVQSPDWLNFFEAWGKKNLDQGVDGIWLDSPEQMFAGEAGWGGGWGCGDTWEGHGFTNYLKANFTTAQLNALGVTDPDNFCLKDYISSKFGLSGMWGDYYQLRGIYEASDNGWVALKTSGVMQDPLMKAFVIYQIESRNAFNMNYTSVLESYAASIGKPDILLTFNGYSTWTPESASNGSPATGIILSSYFPVLTIEENTHVPSPYQTTVATCKTGLAAVDYDKPVWLTEWTLHFSNPYAPDSPPANVSTLIRLNAAQDYASGCIRLVPFGAGTPDIWPTQRLVNGEERNSVGSFYHFIESNKNLFLGAQSTARVALVYSVPEVVWNYMPTFQIEPTAYMVETGGWARALEMLHIPYDIVLLGMKDVYENQDLNPLLGKYDVVIAPGAGHVSDSDLAALANYANPGRKLLVTSGFASYDDWNNQRNSATLRAVLAEPGVVLIPSGIGFKFQNELQTYRSLDSSTLSQLRSILLQNVPITDRIVTDAPPTVFISPMTQGEHERIVVHLVNLAYGYNSSADWTVPDEVQFNMTLPFPSSSWSVRMLSPDGLSANSFSYTISNNVISVKVPNLKLWDMITVQPTTMTTTSITPITTASLTSSSTTNAKGTFTAISTPTGNTTLTTPTPSLLESPMLISAVALVVAIVVATIILMRRKTPSQKR